MTRPYIICHMVTSIDGKVTGNFLNNDFISTGIEKYYDLNRSFAADAFLCGRITMEGSFTNGYYPDLTKYQNIKVAKCDYIARNDAKLYAVACDRKGRLGWKNSTIIDDDPGYGGAHIIEVLTEEVNDEYLAYLQEINVSYIFAGKSELDLLLAMEKLHSLFNIRKLLLEGGSLINGAFLNANLVDEISIVMVPATADKDSKSLFNDGLMQKYRLINCEKDDNNNVYLNYKLEEER